MAERAASTKVDHLGELVHIVSVDDWVSVDWNQKFVALTVDADRVVVVTVGGERVGYRTALARWGELHVDVLAHASGNHAFLLVSDFEIGRLRWQDVQPLWRRRIVDHSHFESVGFVGLEPGEADHRRGHLENAVCAHSIEHVLVGDGVGGVTLASVDQLLLNLKDVLVGLRH